MRLLQAHDGTLPTIEAALRQVTRDLKPQVEAKLRNFLDAQDKNG